MRLHFDRKERIEFDVVFEFGVLLGRNEVACKRSLSDGKNFPFVFEKV